MKRIIYFWTLLLILSVVLHLHPLAAQSLLFGDCLPTGLTIAATACTDGITAGIRQPQALRRPQLQTTIQTDDSVFTLPTRLDDRYAPFAFDAVSATRDGYYPFRYHALNAPGRLLTDSVYVRLKRNERPPLPHDTTITPPDLIVIPPDTVIMPLEPPVHDTVLEPVRFPLPLAVNLVVIDHHGLHRFRILNAESFTRLDLTLYDRHGAVIHRSDNYRNDYDMSRLPTDTYYYRLRAHTPQGSIEKKGFVELVKPQR